MLYVKPKQGRNLKHKSWYKGGVLPMTTSVKVTVSGTSKHTVASKGDDPIFSEVLEFMLGACCTLCSLEFWGWQGSLLLSKHTVASEGNDPIFSEVLEFMLGKCCILCSLAFLGWWGWLLL